MTTEQATPPICGRNWCLAAPDSDGVVTAANFGMVHKMTTAVSAIKVIFANWKPDPTLSEVNGASTYTVRASFYYGGTFHVLNFSGVRDVTVNPGDTVISDELTVSVPDDGSTYVVSYVIVGSGDVWPQVGAAFDAGDVSEIGDVGTVTDKTLTGLGLSHSYVYSFDCVAVIGTPTGSVPGTVALIGDSITHASPSEAINAHGGYWVNKFADQVGFVNLAIGGNTAATWLAGNTKRLALAKYCSNAVVQFGTNDLFASETALSLATKMVTIGNQLVALGIRPHIATIPPRTTSTDSWGTTGNQTPVTNYGPVSERTTYNDWCRTVPAPYVSCIDVGAEMETATNSGIWKVSSTNDGIHPNTTGSGHAVGAIDLAVFTGPSAPDITPPVLATATIGTNGTPLVLEFTETGHLVNNDLTGFSVFVNGRKVTIAGMDRTEATEITIYLTSPVYVGHTVTLSYDSVTGSIIDDASPPNPLASFTNHAVTNNSAIPVPEGLVNTATNKFRSARYGFRQSVDGAAYGDPIGPVRSVRGGWDEIT